MKPVPSAQPDVATGQVWREDDARFNRHVMVTGVFEGGVTVRTVKRAGGSWEYAPRSRDTSAKRERFGKKGGYKGPVAIVAPAPRATASEREEKKTPKQTGAR